MNQQSIDIVTFVNKLIEKTDSNECGWAETSTKDKYQLSLKNGTLTIEYVVGGNWEWEYYKLDVSDTSGSVFATYYGEEKLAKLYEELI